MQHNFDSDYQSIIVEDCQESKNRIRNVDTIIDNMAIGPEITPSKAMTGSSDTYSFQRKSRTPNR